MYVPLQVGDEKAVTASDYVGILNDVIALHKNAVVCRHMSRISEVLDSAEYVPRAVQPHPDGWGSIRLCLAPRPHALPNSTVFGSPHARTPHGGASYVWRAERNQEKDSPEQYHRPFPPPFPRAQVLPNQDVCARGGGAHLLRPGYAPRRKGFNSTPNGGQVGFAGHPARTPHGGASYV